LVKLFIYQITNLLIYQFTLVCRCCASHHPISNLLRRVARIVSLVLEQAPARLPALTVAQAVVPAAYTHEPVEHAGVTDANPLGQKAMGAHRWSANAAGVALHHPMSGSPAADDRHESAPH
jgi:hypothetical protein